ncbi:hypothetical protein [Bosea sp. (in: a-proteobacteria)]
MAEPISEHPLIFARLPVCRYPASSISRRRKRIANAGLFAIRSTVTGGLIEARAADANAHGSGASANFGDAPRLEA